MSKAFTKEDEGPATPQPLSVPRLQPGEIRYITPAGHAALRAELSGLEPKSQRAVQLAALLELLTVQEAAPPDGVVRFGSRVTLRGLDGKGTRTLRLVGPDETKPPAEVSVDSPLARALLGRRVGDEVTLELPRGAVDVEVVEVL